MSETAAQYVERHVALAGGQILKSWRNGYDGGTEYRVFVPDARVTQAPESGDTGDAAT